MKLSRRNFLKLAGVSTASLAFNPLSLIPKDPYDLAGEKRGIARHILMQDILPKNAYARYVGGNHLSYMSYYHNSSGGKPNNNETIKTHQRIYKHTEERWNDSEKIFENSSSSDILVPTGHITTKHRNMKDALQETMDVEDRLFINLAKHIFKKQRCQTVKGNSLGNISDAFATIEQYDLITTSMLMNQNSFNKLKCLHKVTHTDLLTAKEMKQESVGTIGYLWSSSIILSDLMPRNTVYLFAPPDYFGVMPFRVPLYHCVKNYYIEEVGMLILNAHGMSQLKI